MSSICPQPLCFPLDGTSSFPLGEMCDRIEPTPVHWWRETIDCQVSGPVCATRASIFIRRCQAAPGIFSIGLPHIICSKHGFHHQNVTAHVEKGAQAVDGTASWSPLRGKKNKTRQQEFTSDSVKQFFILLHSLTAQNCHFAVLYASVNYLSGQTQSKYNLLICADAN